MKSPLFCFVLCGIIAYLAGGTFNLAVAASQPSVGNGTHFCGVADYPPDKRYSDQYPNRHYARTSAANLNVGEPRTVRLIYFLPNDRPYRADVVQKMKRWRFSAFRLSMPRGCKHMATETQPSVSKLTPKVNQ